MFDGGFFAGLDHKSLQAYRNLRGDKPPLLPLRESGSLWASNLDYAQIKVAPGRKTEQHNAENENTAH